MKKKKVVDFLEKHSFISLEEFFKKYKPFNNCSKELHVFATAIIEQIKKTDKKDELGFLMLLILLKLIEYKIPKK